MKKEKTNVVFIVAIILAILAFGFGLYRGLGSDDDKSNNDSNTNKNENVIELLNNSVKITNLTFEKPVASAWGGGTINTLILKTNIKLECTNDTVAGITLSGYCLDKNDTKYSIVGPLGVMAFYCDNDANAGSGMYVNQVFDSEGHGTPVDWANTDNFKWEDVEIKYCKIDKANVRLTDSSEITTAIELNYENEF